MTSNIPPILGMRKLEVCQSDWMPTGSWIHPPPRFSEPSPLRQSDLEHSLSRDLATGMFWNEWKVLSTLSVFQATRSGLNYYFVGVSGSSDSSRVQVWIIQMRFMTMWKSPSQGRIRRHRVSQALIAPTNTMFTIYGQAICNYRVASKDGHNNSLKSCA